MSTLSFVIGLILVSGGAVGLALVAARVCCLDRLLSIRVVRPSRRKVEFIDSLAAVADVAHREGLLVAERSESVARNPILREGFALALAGESPAVIRGRLEEFARSKRYGVGSLLLQAIQGVSLAVLAGALPAALLILLQPEALGAVAALTGLGVLCAAMVCFAMVGTFADQHIAAAARRDALSIEGAVQIASGQDGRTVRLTLDGAAETSHQPLARAA